VCDIGLTIYKYFFALARTRASKTGLLIDVCAVWNGFIAVWRVGLNTQRKDEITESYLDVEFPKLHEKILDASGFFIFAIVQQYKLHVFTAI
jgi:hypothetical protein